MASQLLEQAMRAAIDEAETALEEGEFPYGAVVIDNAGTIIARAHDTVEQNADPTRHAEIDAVRSAVAETGADLAGSILVCTGEPCAMCSSAAWWAGIRHIAFGVSMIELKELVPDSMAEALGPIEALNQTLQDKITVTQGVLRDDVLALWTVRRAKSERSSVGTSQ